jgi:hypothetical protein
MGLKIPYNGEDIVFSAESIIGQILQHVVEYSRCVWGGEGILVYEYIPSTYVSSCSAFAELPILDAVICVPSYWTQFERQGTLYESAESCRVIYML